MKRIFIDNRVNFQWYNVRLISRLRERFGTTFYVTVGDQTLRGWAKANLAAGDNFDDFATIDAQLWSVPRPHDKAVMATAAANERKYKCIYMRDILQQDRNLALRMLPVAPNSPFASEKPIDLVSIFHRINEGFRWAEGLIAANNFDAIVCRPDSILLGPLIYTGAHHGIPLTFQTPARIGKTMIWSYGPYYHGDQIESYANRIKGDPLPDAELPKQASSTFDDQYNSFTERMNFSTLIKKLYVTTKTYSIWTAYDLLRWKKGKRLPYLRSMRYHYRFWQTAQWLMRNSLSLDAIQECKPFVFFALSAAPEHTTHSMGKEFNDAAGMVRQLALSLPADHTLVVKEHLPMIGSRDVSFYQELARLPNVRLANPRIVGRLLLEQSAAIATLSGSIAFEAAWVGKRALVFARHLDYGSLPNIVRVGSLIDLDQDVAKLLVSVQPDEIEDFRNAARAFSAALKQCGYETPNAPILGGNGPSITPEDLEKSIDLLVEVAQMQRERGPCI